MKAAQIFFSLVLVSFILLSSCGNDATLETSQTTTVKNPGKAIFKKKCTLCHGIKGNLGINGAVDLTTSKMTLEERIEIITKGKKVMTPFKNLLSKEEIELVAKFTQSLRKKDDVPNN